MDEVRVWNAAMSKDEIFDLDFDGLSDVAEFTLGTNPANANTDGDSLTDADDTQPVIPDGKLELIWVDDKLPAGAASDEITTLPVDPSQKTTEPWTWTSVHPRPVSGQLYSRSLINNGCHEYGFTNATATLSVKSGEWLIAYVYLDPVTSPSELMLEWRVGGDSGHRAAFETSVTPLDTLYSSSGGTTYNAGYLPAVGHWVRLAVQADQVGFTSATPIEITGMSVKAYGGTFACDRIGKESTPLVATPVLSPKSNTGPADGSFRDSVSIVVGCSTPGASIHWTTDNSDPASSANVIKSGQAIPLENTSSPSATFTVKVVATATGMTSSPVVAAQYTITHDDRSSVSNTLDSDGDGIYDNSDSRRDDKSVSGFSITITKPSDGDSTYR
jgi:hypothetical protein